MYSTVLTEICLFADIQMPTQFMELPYGKQGILRYIT